MVKQYVLSNEESKSGDLLTNRVKDLLKEGDSVLGIRPRNSPADAVQYSPVVLPGVAMVL